MKYLHLIFIKAVSFHKGILAEWSKARDLSSRTEMCVGSNPTDANLFILSFG